MTRRKQLPVSIKTRIGYSDNTVRTWIPQLLENSPAAISLHGRTFKQLYGGSADWEAIADAAKLACNSKTLILGNGDIKSVEEAEEKIKQYNVDGVLIGRAALGNPWIFAGKSAGPAARLQAAVIHAKLFEKIYGTKHFVPMRKHLGWYCKGFANAVETRLKLINSGSAREVAEIIEEALKKI